MTERVAIYVDGANVYFAQKEALGWWIDWPSFLDVMGEDKDLVTARWYQAYRANPEPEQDRFLHHLTLVGFAVRKKILKSVYDRGSGETTLKGNLDIDLTIDALTEEPRYDTAYLVTGDSDFVPLVEALQTRGKRVVIVATQQNVAVELRQAVGVNYIDLQDLREDVESDKRPPERRSDSFEDSAENDDDYADDEYEYSNGNGNYHDDPPPPMAPRPGDIELPQEGEIVRCRVQAVKKYGVFLDLHEHAKTLLHVKDMNRGYVPDAGQYYRVGDEISVQIVGIDRDRDVPEVRVQVEADENY